MRHEKLRHLPEFTASMEEIRKRLFEEVLSQLKPEEVLSRFRPEERLSGLKPEERLSGLRPEDMLAAMSKSQREKLKKLLENQS